MTVVRALPYVQAGDDLFDCTEWHELRANQPHRLGAAVDDWDSQLTLRLVRTVRFDSDAVRAACRLGESTRLRLLATCRSDRTYVRRVSSAVEVPAGGLNEYQLDFELPGHELGGMLHLTTRLCLGEALPAAPLRPTTPGAVLWEQTAEIRLEGGGSRFPVDVLPFHQLSPRFPKNAAWHLDVDFDALEAPATGALQLLLNGDHPTVSLMLAEPQSDAAQLFAGVLRFETAKTLVVAALENEELADPERRWPADSLGRVMRRLLLVNFGDAMVDRLRTLLRSDRQKFDSLLQHHLRFLEPM